MEFHFHFSVLILSAWHVCGGDEDVGQTHLKPTADFGNLELDVNYKNVWETWNESKPKSERQKLREEKKARLLKNENQRKVLDNSRPTLIIYNSQTSEIDSNSNLRTKWSVGTPDVGALLFLLWVILLVALLRCYCRKHDNSRTCTCSQDRPPDLSLNQSPHISGLHPPSGCSSKILTEPLRRQIVQPPAPALPHRSIPNNTMKVGDLPSYDQSVSYKCPAAPTLEDDDALPPYSAIKMQRN